jgi:hypothetical protein
MDILDHGIVPAYSNRLYDPTFRLRFKSSYFAVCFIEEADFKRRLQSSGGLPDASILLNTL